MGWTYKQKQISKKWSSAKLLSVLTKYKYFLRNKNSKHDIAGTEHNHATTKGCTQEFNMTAL